MTVEERQRRLLQEALMGSIGPDSTDTLMGYLPPVGWADVATKDDLRTLDTVLRGEMESMEHRLRAGIGRLRGEVGGLRGEMESMEHRLRGEMESMEHRLRGELNEFRAEMRTEMRNQFYWMATLMVLLLTAFAAVLKLA